MGTASTHCQYPLAVVLPVVPAVVLAVLWSGMGKRERTKGAVFEREVANLMRSIGYADAKRGIGQARSGGEVPDVDGTPWWIEAKHRKAIDVHGAYQQGADASDDRREVLAVTKRDRGEVLVTMSFATFARLVGQG